MPLQLQDLSFIHFHEIVDYGIKVLNGRFVRKLALLVKLFMNQGDVCFIPRQQRPSPENQ